MGNDTDIARTKIGDYISMASVTRCVLNLRDTRTNENRKRRSENELSKEKKRNTDSAFEERGSKKLETHDFKKLPISDYQMPFYFF